MTITARNYAAQAERDLQRLAGRSQGKSFELTASAFASMIKNAVHFAVPDNGTLLDDKWKGIRGVEIRLPYPLITLEYWSESRDVPGQENGGVRSHKRLIIAMEYPAAVVDSMPNTGIGAEMKSIIGKSSVVIFVLSIFHVQDIDAWLFMPIGILLPSHWEATITPAGPGFMFKSEDGAIVNGKMVAVDEDSWRETMATVVDHDAAVKGLGADIAAEGACLLEFLEALSCSNVGTEVIQKANIGKKRAAKGKLPIYETKVLTVLTPTTRQKSSGQGGTHAAPRMHLRRGHIRRLEDGRKIWVNACVVGAESDGVISKGYKIKPRKER